MANKQNLKVGDVVTLKDGYDICDICSINGEFKKKTTDAARKGIEFAGVILSVNNSESALVKFTINGKTIDQYLCYDHLELVVAKTNTQTTAKKDKKIREKHYKFFFEKKYKLDKDCIELRLRISKPLQKLLAKFACKTEPLVENSVNGCKFKRYAIKRVLKSIYGWTDYTDLFFEKNLIDKGEAVLTLSSDLNTDDFVNRMNCPFLIRSCANLLKKQKLVNVIKAQISDDDAGGDEE